MNDRILAKTVTRALLSVLADITPRSDEARHMMATLLTDATLEATGGCPQKVLEVAQFLSEVRSELEAETAGLAQSTVNRPAAAAGY